MIWHNKMRLRLGRLMLAVYIKKKKKRKNITVCLKLGCGMFFQHVLLKP